MRSKIPLVRSVLLLAALPTLGQSGGVLPLKAQLLKSRQATTLLFNGYQSSAFNFRIELDPAANVQAIATPGEYSVNGWPLAIRVASAAANDTAALRRFVASEKSCLLKNIPEASIHIRPYERQFTDKTTGRRCFVWGLSMPEALNKNLDGV